MTNIGVLYPFLDGVMLNSISQIIEDYQQKTIEATKKEYLNAHRDLLPSDSVIGRDEDNWSTNAIGNAQTKVCNITTATKVDTDQAVLVYGWYCNKDLGEQSRFYVNIDDKIRAQVSARTVYESPGHFLLTPKTLVWALETHRLSFWIDNKLGAGKDVFGTFYPLAVLFGERAVLGVD